MRFQDYRVKKIFFLGILIIYGYGYSQKTVNFTAFGYQPQSVPDSLYHQLRKTSDSAVKADLVWRIGEIHLDRGNTDSIIHYGNWLKKLGNGITKQNNFKPKAFWLIGNGKLNNGLYEEALKAFIDGLNHLENSGYDDDFKPWLRLGLAKSYFRQGKKQEAKSIFEVLQQNNIPQIKTLSGYYLALISKENGKFPEAKLLFENSIELAKKHSLPRIQLASQLRLGQISIKENDHEKALDQFIKVLQKSLNHRYYDLHTEAAMLCGELNIQLKRYENAEIVLATAYANSINWNNLDLQKKIINSLRKTYEAKGDFENAYNLMTQYVSVSDRITKNQNTKEIQNLEVRYRTLEKENTILELQEEKLKKEAEVNRQRTIKKAFLIGFLVLLVPIIALLFVYYQKIQAQSKVNQQQTELNEQHIKSLKSQQELELAKASLNAQTEERARIAKQLHDGIGGNLAGIKLQLSNLPEKKGLEKEIIKQVDQTYELVREISHNLTPKMFMSSDFTSLLEQFSEKLNSTANTGFALFAHPKERLNQLSDEHKVEVYQIIQELTTNALKHANANQMELHLNIHDNVLQLLFEDNGIGFNTKNTSNGIGLKNIQQRLQKLNASMILDSAINRGTAVTIEIPLKS